MLRAAAHTVRVEQERGIGVESRGLSAENLAFWRRRFTTVWTQSCERARTQARQASLPRD